MKTILFLSSFLVLSACSSEALLSDKEKHAIDKVLAFYGGECNWTKGFETVNGKRTDFFELSMSSSDLLDRYADKIEMPATNIAYMFYSNLGAEKKKFTLIRVKIDLGKDGDYEKDFTAKDLREIEHYAPYIPLIEKLAKAQDYATLWSTFDEEIQGELSEEQLRTFFQRSDSVFGSFDALQLQGHRFNTSQVDGRPMVQLSCVVIRDKENTPLSLFFDRKTHKLMGMNEQF